jgi:hypothetical protein
MGAFSPMFVIDIESFFSSALVGFGTKSRGCAKTDDAERQKTTNLKLMFMAAI